MYIFLKDLDPLSLFTWEPGAGAGEPGASYILSFGSREPRSREPAIKIDGSETLYTSFKNKHFWGQIDNFMTSIAIFNLETWNSKTKRE